MSFMVYDLVLLGMFIIFLFIFLYSKRKNLKKEGLFFLYKAEWGIKLINKIGDKYKRTLKVLSYVSITLGYILMVSMLYLLGRIVWIYLFQPNIVRMIKIPPILPLFPYLPQVFKLDFLPPFYFTYWIMIIAIIAITHEFAHGIFAAYKKVRIKKTGFGFFPFFLPIFLAAFVELDEEQMAKKSKISQMAILSAGAFANIITAIFFFFVLWGVFSVSFVPAGVIFNNYVYSPLEIASINSINGIAVNNPTYLEIYEIVDKSNKSKVEIIQNEKSYFVTKGFLDMQQNVQNYMLAYVDAPALQTGLTGAIVKINGVKVISREALLEEVLKYSPGDEIVIETKTENEIKQYNLVLSENPHNPELPFLGIGFISRESGGILARVNNAVYSVKDPNVYYEERFVVALFIYDLLLWIILISLSVGLINMLPMGIFDGGRFFLLTVWGITKSKEKAQKVFKFSTWFILFIAFLLMVFWAFNMFR